MPGRAYWLSHMQGKYSLVYQISIDSHEDSRKRGHSKWCFKKQLHHQMWPRPLDLEQQPLPDEQRPEESSLEAGEKKYELR